MQPRNPQAEKYILHIARNAIEAFIKAYSNGYTGSLQQAGKDLKINFKMLREGPSLEISLNKKK